MWKWKDWFGAEETILLYQTRCCFPLDSGWEKIYLISFCIDLEKKNAKSSNAQSLNLILSLH